MDSSEYPELAIFAGTFEGLQQLDEEYGSDVVLYGILGTYLRFFHDMVVNNRTFGSMYRPVDTGWGKDEFNPRLITVGAYIKLEDSYELRLSMFGPGDYLNYVDAYDRQNTEDFPGYRIPEFVFTIDNHGLGMKFVLRNMKKRMEHETLVVIENGKAKALDHIAQELVPFVQKIWDTGNGSYIGATFSIN